MWTTIHTGVRATQQGPYIVASVLETASVQCSGFGAIVDQLRAKGSTLSWGELYSRYRRWCSECELAAIAANEFGKRLDALRADGVLRVKAKGDEVYCVDVRLVA
jgi:hypothetical protein